MVKYDKNAAALQSVIKYCDKASEARKRFGDSYDIFSSDTDYQSCCSMYVFQISEYCNHLSDSIKTAYPNIPWQQIKGMRNLLAHDYEALITTRLWGTLQHDLPRLRENYLKILLNLGHEYPPDEKDDEQLVDEGDN